MTKANEETKAEKTPEPLPGNVARAIDAAGSSLNRHVMIDARLCGVGASVACAAPVAFVLGAGGVPLAWAGVAAGAAFVFTIAYEARRRWHDTLDGALVLDKLLKSNDRFSTALQFSRNADPPNLH